MEIIPKVTKQSVEQLVQAKQAINEKQEGGIKPLYERVYDMLEIRRVINMKFLNLGTDDREWLVNVDKIDALGGGVDIGYFMKLNGEKYGLTKEEYLKLTNFIDDINIVGRM